MPAFVQTIGKSACNDIWKGLGNGSANYPHCRAFLRVHSKAGARELMDYFQDAGFLEYEILDEETEVLRYTISDWKRHCVHLEYNYYSYKGSGFFFFPLPGGRQLVRHSKAQGSVPIQ